MAQTTTSLPLGCGKLEIDEGCTGSWTDISGSSTSLDPITQDRLTGEAYTLEGLGALVNGGKVQPFDATFTIVYTETVGEAWLRTLAVWEGITCDSETCVRWSPAGGNVGDLQYTIQGPMSSITYPNNNASEGGVIMAGFKVRAPTVTRDTITS
jgi:hypothetical protein